MKVQIKNTTDDKFIGSIITFNGIVDDLYLCDDVMIELISYDINENHIKLVSNNYMIEGLILEV